MRKNTLLAGYKIFFAALVLVAITVQYTVVPSKSSFMATNFFSFFTIESNIIAMLVFAASAAALLTGKASKTLAWFRGAAALYMTITGVVYILLLSGQEEALQTTVPWVNIVLHYLFPLVALADWFIDPPRHKVSVKLALLWLLFPLAYLVYSLVRGAATHWYPYPFLNPANGGYGSVAIASVAIAAFAFALAMAFAWASKRFSATAGAR